MQATQQMPTPAKPPRLPRRALHGVLLLNKPLGWSSNDALQKVKGLLRAEKGGHTGTLDPLATGVLPLCFGAATKFAHANLDADKRYRATLHLGLSTSTGDGEGQVLSQVPVTFNLAQIKQACSRFVGAITQVPPMHSALKHEGKPLYEYARAGQEVVRESRAVHIHGIELVSWKSPQLVIDVSCSKGTYIRTLAEDIGQALGCGASLSALQRTSSGPFELIDCIELEALKALSAEQQVARLLPVESLVSQWPAITLAPPEAGRFLTGLRRRVSHGDVPAIRVYGSSPAAFLGSAHIQQGELIAQRLLSPLEVQASLAPELAASPVHAPL